jgi:hypothetical protein
LIDRFDSKQGEKNKVTPIDQTEIWEGVEETPNLNSASWKLAPHYRAAADRR